MYHVVPIPRYGRWNGHVSRRMFRRQPSCRLAFSGRKSARFSRRHFSALAFIVIATRSSPSTLFRTANMAALETILNFKQSTRYMRIIFKILRIFGRIEESFDTNRIDVLRCFSNIHIFTHHQGQGPLFNFITQKPGWLVWDSLSHAAWGGGQSRYVMGSFS